MQLVRIFMSRQGLGLQLKAQLLSPATPRAEAFTSATLGRAPVLHLSDIYQFSLNAGLILGWGASFPTGHRTGAADRPRALPYYNY